MFNTVWYKFDLKIDGVELNLEPLMTTRVVTIFLFD